MCVEHGNGTGRQVAFHGGESTVVPSPAGERQHPKGHIPADAWSRAPYREVGWMEIESWETL